MKIAKNIYTILCDDVRQEVGNKVSLMGIYSKDILVNKVPVILPHLCLAIFIEGLQTPFSKVRVTVKTPEAEPINITSQPPSKLKGDNFNIVIGMAPFRIKGTGQAKFELHFDDAKKPNVVHNFIIKERDKS